jgi:membrane-associated protease RseP (regulator of RpoE activity)
MTDSNPSPDFEGENDKPPNENEFDHLHEMMDQLDDQIAEYHASLSTPVPPVDSQSPTIESAAIPKNSIPMSTDDPRVGDVPRWKFLHLALFVLTFVSCFYKGMTTGDIPAPPPEATGFTPEMISALLWNGFLYSFPVMLILFSHEMGHYLQARRYKVAASPPFFIPMPLLPFGTMGAVIVQRSGYADRKILYDIAISGPLAGLVFALPIAWMGILDSEVRSRTEFVGQSVEFGDPLVMQWMYEWVHGPLGPDQVIMLNPLLFAGWVGIFITALNLIPIGQLDGGHILYSLIGRRAHVVAMLLVYGTLAYMVATGNFQYALMLGLIVLMGPRHPPTANDKVPLGWFRIILGWLTLAFIIIGFTPVPMSIQ